MDFSDDTNNPFSVDFPGKKCKKYLGRICRLEKRSEDSFLWERGCGTASTRLDHILDCPWDDVAYDYDVSCILPLEEFYLEGDGPSFSPSYQDYKGAVTRAIGHMDSFSPVEPGTAVLYGDCSRRWRAQAVASFVNVSGLPVMYVGGDSDGTKLVILETSELRK